MFSWLTDHFPQQPLALHNGKKKEAAKRNARTLGNGLTMEMASRSSRGSSNHCIHTAPVDIFRKRPVAEYRQDAARCRALAAEEKDVKISWAFLHFARRFDEFATSANKIESSWLWVGDGCHGCGQQRENRYPLAYG